MSDMPGISPDYALFKRWQDGSGQARRRELPPDPLELAAYIDGTMDAAASAAIEAALAENPDLIPVVFGVETGAGREDAVVSPDLIRRLQALVPETGAEIIAFPSSRPEGKMGSSDAGRTARRATVRPLAVWAAMAASLVFVSIAGFSAGMSVEQAINRDAVHDAMLDFDEAALMDENVG